MCFFSEPFAEETDVTDCWGSIARGSSGIDLTMYMNDEHNNLHVTCIIHVLILVLLDNDFVGGPSPSQGLKAEFFKFSCA